MLLWKEIRIEKGSKEAQRVPWDSLFCLKPLSPSTGGALGMLQLSCAVTVSGGCSALTFTIPQAHHVQWHMVAPALSLCLCQARLGTLCVLCSPK